MEYECFGGWPQPISSKPRERVSPKHSTSIGRFAAGGENRFSERAWPLLSTAFVLPYRLTVLAWLPSGKPRGRYENFLRAMHVIPPELRGRIHVKTFDAGIAVRATNPQRHGEVGSRFRFWRPECWQPEPAMQEHQLAPEACVYGR